MIAILLENLIPLYILIGLGYIAGRWLDVNLHSMAIIAIYILAPIVNFGAMARLPFDLHFIALPVMAYLISTITGLIMYKTARHAWQNNTANLIAMGSVTGNTGYFGLPLVLALFGPEWVGLYLFMNLGAFINEVSLGYYFGARGNAVAKDAILKVIKLPVLHAVWLGLLFNLLHIELPGVFYRYWDYATGAWVIIGMMLIGVALGKLPRLEFDGRLMAWMFTPKFILWPLGGWIFVLLDMMVFHSFEPLIYKLVLIFTSVPLAGNIVAFAATLRLHPERAATAVLASTVLAIAVVPGNLMLFDLFRSIFLAQK
ncbi:MAG: AEC family transporter [Rhodospirillales bacterium]|nr:AEC family transporter [Rhodospirillales bacterium]MCB9996876.1 AEC family transporter [Rhodospirillales bacterium]